MCIRDSAQVLPANTAGRRRATAGGWRDLLESDQGAVRGQFTISRFICPNASDLPHGTVGKPLATRQELFSRTPLQPAKTGLLDGRAVIYSNPVDVMPERTYGTERYSAGQWADRNRRVEVSGSAPQIPSGPNGPWDLDPPAPALNTSMPREDKAFAAQRVQ